MKRFLSLFLALTLMVSSLTGCGSGAASSAPPAQPAVAETVRWLTGTYAIINRSNGWKLDVVGGLKPGESNTARMKSLLSEWWGVTDRASADENLQWLLTEGHRTYYQNTVYNFAIDTLTAEDREIYLAVIGNDGYEGADLNVLTTTFDAYMDLGSAAMDAWDYSRAIQCLGYYYVAGYYTLEESLDLALPIGQKLQETFSSWEEFARSYLWGYQFWNEDDGSDPESATAKRRAVYEEIKALPESPYNLDWNLELTKSW